MKNWTERSLTCSGRHMGTHILFRGSDRSDFVRCLFRSSRDVEFWMLPIIARFDDRGGRCFFDSETADWSRCPRTLSFFQGRPCGSNFDCRFLFFLASSAAIE